MGKPAVAADSDSDDDGHHWDFCNPPCTIWCGRHRWDRAVKPTCDQTPPLHGCAGNFRRRTADGVEREKLDLSGCDLCGSDQFGRDLITLATVWTTSRGDIGKGGRALRNRG